MDLIALIMYALVNLAMITSCLMGQKGKLYELPFWMGIMAVGWFLPMAIGGYKNMDTYPDGSYGAGMLFASLCSLAVWAGFHKTARSGPCSPTSWLAAQFDLKKLKLVGAVLTLLGFFFYWKLQTLPEEVTSQTQWSGAAVKYLFLANIFIFGFLVLWLLYLDRGQSLDVSSLIFITPSLLSLLNSALIGGRRAEMMNLVSFVLIGLWFVRRVSLPKWMLVGGLVCGLMLVNAIGIYRSVMKIEGATLTERLKMVSLSEISQENKKLTQRGGGDFSNYIVFRQTVDDTGRFDFGLAHWNGLVFNYVPAQIVGRGFKQALMLPMMDPIKEAKKRYDHHFHAGTLMTGYYDSYASFGWLGFVKFYLIGLVMGTLYRYAMSGFFLGQLLYIYLLSMGMHSISHGTNSILLSQWVYFLALGYPAIRWAQYSADAVAQRTIPPAYTG